MYCAVARRNHGFLILRKYVLVVSYSITHRKERKERKGWKNRSLRALRPLRCLNIYKMLQKTLIELLVFMTHYFILILRKHAELRINLTRSSFFPEFSSGILLSYFLPYDFVFSSGANIS